MKNFRLFVSVFILSFLSISAQDTTKAIRHEIGFNTVSLIKQIVSNNPGNTLSQLPYDVFYNLYFNEKVGMRLGLGIRNSSSTTEIEGQKEPRKNNQFGLNLRAGISNNFVKQNRITLNAFADVLYENFSLKTINTSTSQSFPNPVVTIKTTSSDVVTGVGGQIGVGVKYNLYKNLSVYAEVPFGFMIETSTSKVTIEETGSPADNSTTKSNSSSLRITIPTTIYLVLRF